jgi:hypothetical protein
MMFGGLQLQMIKGHFHRARELLSCYQNAGAGEKILRDNNGTEKLSRSDRRKVTLCRPAAALATIVALLRKCLPVVGQRTSIQHSNILKTQS